MAGCLQGCSACMPAMLPPPAHTCKPQDHASIPTPTCQGSSRFLTRKEAATTRMRLCIHPVPHSCVGERRGRQGVAED